MINFNCPKCSKSYELEDNLLGKSWRCTCWEIFDIIKPQEELKLYAPWDYFEESLNFLKDNLTEVSILIIVMYISILFSIRFIVMLGPFTLLWLILLLITFIIWRIFIIKYVLNKWTSNKYTVLNSIIDSKSKIVDSLLTSIWITLRYVIYIIFLWMFIWEFYYINLYFNKPILNLTNIIIQICWVIILLFFNLKYSFVYQNILNNAEDNWISTIKQSTKQVKNIKYQILTIKIVIYWIALLFIVTVISQFKNIFYVVIFDVLTLLIAEIFCQIILTKLFINITWINNSKGSL